MDIAKYPFQGIVPGSILKDRSVVGSRQMDCRRSHGFIIKLKGATQYYTDQGSWLLSAGEILYVAKGASYFIREVEPGFSYVVNFECTYCGCSAVEKLRLPLGFDLSAPADKMYHSWQKETGAYAALSCLYSILSKTVTAQQETYISSRERGLLEPVLTYLQKNLTNPDLKLESLSQMAGVSDTYLRRVFRKQHGAAPGAYVARERIRLAKGYLQSGLPVAAVAAKVGYRDPLYFSRLFKKQVGLSPTQYCAQHLEDLF